MHWFPWQININLPTHPFIHHPLIHQYHSFYKNNNNTTTTTTYNNIYKK